METFRPPLELVEHPAFATERLRSLAAMADAGIDAPIRPLIRRLNSRPYCFTLQCCYGHFVHAGQPDPHNLDPLPRKAIPTAITYRIAYLALCIDNSAQGRRLLDILGRMPELAPEFIQFGSPTWFWQRQVNAYALQVEPQRFKHLDQVVLEYAEARQVEGLRSEFFNRLAERV